MEQTKTGLGREIDDRNNEGAVADRGLPDLNLARAACDVDERVGASYSALVNRDKSLEAGVEPHSVFEGTEGKSTPGALCCQ